MNFFDLADEPSFYQKESERINGSSVEYGYFESNLNEEQGGDGSWVGRDSDGTVVYRTGSNAKLPNYNITNVIPSPANINLLSVPQLTVFNPFTYEIAGHIRSYVKNVSPITDVSTLSNITGISEQSLGFMSWRSRLILRGLQNINRVHTDSLVSGVVDNSQEDALKSYISNNGYITDENELKNVLSDNDVKLLKMEGIFAAPPINIQHLSSQDFERILPSSTSLNQALDNYISDNFPVVDEFASFMNSLGGKELSNFNQLKKMGVKLGGVSNINHSKSMKKSFNAYLLDDVPGTNAVEDDLQTKIQNNGYFFNRTDIQSFVQANLNKLSLILGNLGLYFDNLRHLDHFKREDLADFPTLSASEANLVFDEIQSSKSISSKNDLPAAVNKNNEIVALNGLYGPRMNINTMSVQNLAEVPGITQSEAQKIDVYRRKQGDITSFDDFEQAVNWT